VHRDIKPGNVMLTPQGQVKVMDFGIARAVADTSSTMTQTAAVIGTAQYLSPEQARGETVDARSDLYSTGCLLYELLVGRPPFVGESPVSVAYQHVREEPVPPSSFDPDIPAEVDAVVLKALTKNREHRYQSAAEMRQDIHRVLSGQQVTAPMAAVAETRSIPSTVAPTAVAAAAYGQSQPDDLLPGDGNDELQAAKSRRNRGLAYFLLGLAIVAVAVGAYAIFTNLNGKADTPAGPVQVAVPSVAGMTIQQATTLLTQKGLNVASTTQSNDQVPVGKIVRQNPPTNVMVDKGSTVAVVVSGGPGLFPVPDVIGKTESQARTQLEKSPGNFQVATDAKTQDDPAPAGQVLKISPDPNSKYPAGQVFTLTVSTGNVKVQVPDVRTQSQADATSILKGAGLNVGYVQAPDASAPEGTVIKQSIAPTQRVDKGTKVIITIAVKPPVTTPTSPTSPTSPSGDPSGNPSPTLGLPGNGGFHAGQPPR
jgi:beta-lactam-binding protein with PASTA domain